MNDPKIEQREITADDSAAYKWGVGEDVTFRIHGQLAADDPYHNLIGQLVSTWAHFEHAIDLLIWDLLAIPHSQAALTTRGPMSVSARLDHLIKLAADKGVNTNIIQDIEALKPKALELQEQRNRIIHDPWYIDKDDGTVGQFRSMAKSNPCFGIHDVDAEAVARLTAETREQWDLVSSMWDRIFAQATGADQP